MIKMKKYIILAAALSFILPAQSQYNNEITVSLGAGSSDLNGFLPGLGSPEYWSCDRGLGGGLGAAYAHYFTGMLGVSLGLEAEMYNNQALRRNYYEERSLVETPPGLSGNFWLERNIGQIKEKQSATFLQVPVMLKFQFPVFKKKTFLYADAGVKFGFPVASKWEQNIESITTKGYSEYTGQYYENMPNHGFSTYSDLNASGKFDIKPSVTYAFELGMKWTVGEGKYLYTGLFLNSGKAKITDSSVDRQEHTGDFPGGYPFNSFIGSEIKPFAVGVKLKFGFGIGGKKPNKPETPKQGETPKKPDEPKKPVTREQKTESVR